MRGRELFGCCSAHSPGNTPACAGKRRTRGPQEPLSRKYPRVCGEERRCSAVVTLSSEIPPRVRGRALGADTPGWSIGNTPACAGKSIASMACVGAMAKYPRVCGEEIHLLNVASRLMEIPPRVRGRDYLISNFISCLPVFRDFWGHPCRSKLCHLAL